MVLEALGHWTNSVTTVLDIYHEEETICQRKVVDTFFFQNRQDMFKMIQVLVIILWKNDDIVY